MKLLCPICKNELSLNDPVYVCCNQHSFDISKNGYVNLFVSNQTKLHGDNKEMVQARTSFLEKNYYRSLLDTINIELNKIQAHSLIDLACGEGYYTRSFIGKDILGIDLSKEAINYACKMDKKNKYCIASIFDLPIQSESIDCITTLFAPVPIKEIERVLNKEGHFFVAYPGQNHLYELKERLYDIPYLNEPPVIETNLTLIDEMVVHHKITLTSNEDIEHLFMMTPYYYKTSMSDKNKIENITNLDLTLEFIIKHFKK